jgi:hypothetical protein
VHIWIEPSNGLVKPKSRVDYYPFVSGLEAELKELNRKLEIMMGRLDYLEAALIESRQYPEITHIMGDLKVGASLYTEPLKLIERLMRIKRQLARDEEHRDEISRIILNVLALKGPQYIGLHQPLDPP